MEHRIIEAESKLLADKMLIDLCLNGQTVDSDWNDINKSFNEQHALTYLVDHMDGSGWQLHNHGCRYLDRNAVGIRIRLNETNYYKVLKACLEFTYS